MLLTKILENPAIQPLDGALNIQHIVPLISAREVKE